MKKTPMHRHEIYKLVKQAVKEADPIGLLAVGCPDDGYEPEIHDITEHIGNCRTVTEIQGLLHQTFVKWFDEVLAGDRSAYLKMAKRLQLGFEEALKKAVTIF